MSDISVPQQPSVPVQEGAPGSLPRRILDTFVAPIALVQRFGARPPWVDVMAIAAVLSAVGYALVPTEVWVAMAEEMARQQPNAPQPMDPQAMGGMQRWISVGGTLVMSWLMMALQAGVMVLVFSVVLGGRATFRQYVSVVSHAMLIGAVGVLATLPIIISRQDLRAGITLAALVPGADPQSFLYQFLNVFNVFLVWQVVVMGLGAHALNRRIGAGTAVGVMLAILAAVAAGAAAIF
jgi:Na+/melibiose symporter-like transporter